MTARAVPLKLTDDVLRRVGIGLSIAGLLVSLYLVYIKYNPTSALCLSAGGCERVNSSVYSEINGIPIAALGALAYAAMLGLLLLEPAHDLLRQWAPLGVFGLALAGTLYSAYLTYIELAVLHAVCPYCVTSAVIITLIWVGSIFRLGRYV